MYKLLIVEDEHLIRKWIRYTPNYEEINITVVGEAKNGKEGYELIQALKPDIVLTDINMPMMSGFEMMSRTEEINYIKIVLSGYNDFENAKKAMQLGVKDFVVKPIQLNELMTVLTKVVDNLNKGLIMRQDSHLTKIQSLLPSYPLNSIEEESTIKVIEWLNQHYDASATVAEIAREIGYSESILYKNFKDTMGITINQYRTEIRISKAIEIFIKNPHLKIYQVSNEVGFQDYNYFNQLFKKYIGMSAKQFKDSL